MAVELGVFTFGDVMPDPVTGRVESHAQKMRDVVKLGKLADEVGLDVFAVGEHHRLDMVVSSPPVVLAAVAAQTERIKLSSATTLLNTLDPVRVFEDYASLDLVSDGRAELILGRGSFTESFSLFGYDMKDYDSLFADKLDLFLKLNANATVTWQGKHRAPLTDAEISPRPTRPLPLWMGVGGTPESAVRAGMLGIPLTLAILGGPDRFPGVVELHKQGWAKGGHDPAARRVAVSSHGFLADDGDEARRHFGTYWGTVMRNGLKNRFPPRAMPQEYLDLEMGPRGAFFAGTAKDAIEKVRWERKLLGIDRLLLSFDWGGVSFKDAARSIEILGQEVLPAVRDL